jgi:hypothetical protein
MTQNQFQFQQNQNQVNFSDQNTVPIQTVSQNVPLHLLPPPDYETAIAMTK